MVVIVSCPNCKKKIPALVGENNKCPHCGHQFYLERRFRYSKRRYDSLKEDYFWLYEAKKFIRENRHLSKKEIYKELRRIPRYIIDEAICELEREGIHIE